MPTHQELPEQFGRYRIIEKLGAGGMGAVYLAEDAKLRRKVALKVPHFTAGTRAAGLDRFQREARLAAGIDHPNFCAVYDVDEVDGIHFFTMAYVEGTPLSDLIADGQPWPPPQAVQMVRLVALAVGQLHSRGIIHRDLKPANIMVRPTGEPVLMDFGLACSLTSQSERLTATGEVLGTPAYMPPEQLQGDRKQQGPASDVYSLGMILYQLLTGQLPFEGSLAAVCAQALSKMPEAPSVLKPGLDARLDAICLKALAKKPEDRFPDTSAFVAALDKWLAGLAAPTVPQPRPGFVAHRQETISSSGLETATRPLEQPSSARPRRGFVFPLLMVGVVCLLLAIAVKFMPPRADGTSEPKLPDKTADQKKDETIHSAELTQQFTNKLKMQMVRIKKGTFKMGSLPEDNDKYGNEVAQHPVKINRDFYMGATEVTRGQFKQFVDGEGYKTEAEKAGDKNTWKENESSTNDDQPVVYVSWNDAVAFCKWLSNKEDKKYYDLPTEAEWEYACRAGGEAEDVYCFGNDSDKLGDYAWFNGNSGSKTHPVRKKKPNKWDLYDMHGNVWEWCKDGKRPYPDQETAEKQKEPIEDPEGPLDGQSRILHGGSLDCDPRDCRSALRAGNAPHFRDNNIGFRVVLRPGLRAP